MDALSRQHGQETEWLDYRAALVCAMLAEINRDRKKRRKPFTAADFMPKRAGAAPEHPSPEALQDRIRLINAALGGIEVPKT